MQKPEKIPVTPGVYLYKDAGGRIIYVGKARNLRKRVLSYFRPPDQLTSKTRAMISKACSVDFLSTNTEKEALLLEASLIKKHRPHYNIVLRDDKQYVMFRIDEKTAFPRLETVRKIRKDGARYFGPFTSAQAARETWKTIHKTFALRRCTDRAMNNRARPCLYHHIGLCLAPCTEDVSREEYMELIRRVVMLLSGKSRELIDSLTESMEQAAENLDFEQAALLRDQRAAIEKTVERQGVVLKNTSDMDVLGLVTRNDGLGLGLIFVRGGAVMDRSTFFWPGLGLENAAELLSGFLTQFYGPERDIPPRIVLPWLPGENHDLPDFSDTPELPELLNAPDLPDAPDTPDLVELPDTPELSDAPDTPELPELLGTPDLAELSDTPELSGVTEISDILPDTSDNASACSEDSFQRAVECHTDSQHAGDVSLSESQHAVADSYADSHNSRDSYGFHDPHDSHNSPDEAADIFGEGGDMADRYDFSVIAEMLSEWRGSPVRILAARTQEDQQLVDMAKSNAREAAMRRTDIPLEERLALVLHRAEPVRRIECVDVSHTGGRDTKVGAVIYQDGKPLKADYRVWNIEGANGDDYAALSMWAQRRVEHGSPWPDLMLIDGGKGQISAVNAVFEKAFDPMPFMLAGIAKARDDRGHADRRAGNLADRIFVPNRSNPLNIREGSAELLYLQSVRDATHDFAIGRHRQARARRAFDAELTRLPGVGPHIARILWDTFQNLEAMRAASPEQLAAIPGIGKKRAITLAEQLKKL